MASASSHPDTPSVADTPAPLTALIVDDDADMRLYVRGCLHLLQRPLCNVLDAADGLAALTLASEMDLDLVISDVCMPRLDGYALRAALAAQGVPVLLISGAFAADDTPDPEVLAKPFNALTLCMRIRALLDPAATA